MPPNGRCSPPRPCSVWADAIGPRLRALVIVGGFVGIRSGELPGLRRQDIDIARRVVHVRLQAHEITGIRRILVGRSPKQDAAPWHFLARCSGCPPTTFGGTRHSSQAVRRSRGPRGAHFGAATLSNAWKGACAAVGVSGVHPHDLRHHVAVLTARNPNVTLPELMATIGHSSPAAALRHQHATEERGREVADYLDAAIATAKTETAGVIVELHPTMPRPPRAPGSGDEIAPVRKPPLSC